MIRAPSTCFVVVVALQISNRCCCLFFPPFTATQIQGCDAILARMQEMLLGFQADLGGISDEIKHLQVRTHRIVVVPQPILVPLVDLEPAISSHHQEWMMLQSPEERIFFYRSHLLALPATMARFKPSLAISKAAEHLCHMNLPPSALGTFQTVPKCSW